MRIWIVDVFAERPFSGATAAVLPLDAWIDEETMRAIAAQNAATETAFLTPTGLRGNYELRTFTPRGDAPLSGHAALAAGAALLTDIEPHLELAVFETLNGPLVARRAPEGFAIDLPRRPRTPWTPPQSLLDAVTGEAEIEDAFAGEYATLVLETEAAVRGLAPDFGAIARLIPGPRAGCLAVAARAEEGSGYDYVCRFFAPGAGVTEDAVTASSLCDLTAYWCDRLDRANVTGLQASKRGGVARGRRTLSSSRLAGPASIYLRGELAAVDARRIERAGEPALLAASNDVAPREDDLVVHVRDADALTDGGVVVFAASR